MVVEREDLDIEEISLLEDQSLIVQILVKDDILLVLVNILDAYVIINIERGSLIETSVNVLVQFCKYTVKGKRY